MEDDRVTTDGAGDRTGRRYARRLAGVGGRGSGAWAVHARAVERRRRGEDVLMASVGDPDFATPEAVVAAAKDALDRGETRYAAIAGLPDLRAAIAADHRRTTGQDVASERVVVLAGAQCALFVACQCLLDPGDAVLAFEPAYVTYPATVAAAGAELLTVPPRPGGGFRPDLDAAARMVGPSTRAVLLNSPNNPAGTVFTAEETAAVLDLCRRRDLWLIADEVYAGLVFDGRHTAPAGLPGGDERVVTISGLSKSHAMTGWRLGWLVGPKDLADHAERLGLCMLYGTPPFVQRAAIAALTLDLPEVAAMRESYRARRDRALRLIGESPDLACEAPAGGMFLMIDVRAAGRSAGEFAASLLDEEAVAVLPADPFGPSAEGHVRFGLTLAGDRLDEACRRIVRHAGRLRWGGA